MRHEVSDLSPSAADRPVRTLSIVTRMALAGGASHVASLLADGLAQAGFDSYLAYGTTPPTIAPLQPPPSVTAIELPELKKSLSPWDELRAFRRLRALMRELRPTIVLTHSSKAGVLGRAAAHLERVPIILHQVHGWSFHEGSGLGLRQAAVTLERWLGARTDALLFVSTKDIEKARHYRIGRQAQYHVVRAGIDLAKFKPATPETRLQARELLALPDDVLVVGTVARIDTPKAPRDWAAACALIAHQLPKAHFVWVGDGPQRSVLKADLEKAGIADRVTLTGFRDDVERLYAAFDVFLLLSLWEGLPRTIVEAMATGTPVVATAVDGNAEIVEHGTNGLLVPPGRPLEAADAVCMLAADADLRARMSAHGVQRSREFSARKSVEDLVGICRALLTSKAH